MPDRDKIPHPPKQDEDEELFETVVSSTECTGLIPAIPETDEETECLEELYELPKEEGRL